MSNGKNVTMCFSLGNIIVTDFQSISIRVSVLESVLRNWWTNCGSYKLMSWRSFRVSDSSDFSLCEDYAEQGMGRSDVKQKSTWMSPKLLETKSYIQRTRSENHELAVPKKNQVIWVDACMIATDDQMDKISRKRRRNWLRGNITIREEGIHCWGQRKDHLHYFQEFEICWKLIPITGRQIRKTSDRPQSLQREQGRDYHQLPWSQFQVWKASCLRQADRSTADAARKKSTRKRKIDIYNMNVHDGVFCMFVEVVGSNNFKMILLMYISIFPDDFERIILGRALLELHRFHSREKWISFTCLKFLRM